MKTILKTLSGICQGALIVLIASALPAMAQESEQAAVEMEIDAVATAIDTETREITMTSSGLGFVLYVPEKVINLADIKVGDRLVGRYFVAAEVETRQPTAEELADPWVIIQEGAVSEGDEGPAVETARLVRAVVTVTAIDPDEGVIVVTDYRRKYHLIANVEAEKLADLAVDETVVVEFTEAMALTLEKK